MTKSEQAYRILGGNEIWSGSWRPLVLITGNNATLSEDMTRRVLTASLKFVPGKRFSRKNPTQYALKRRPEIVRAVYTLAGAFLERCGSEEKLRKSLECRGVGLASVRTYHDWSTLCRFPIVWLAAECFFDAAGVSIDKADCDPGWMIRVEVEARGSDAEMKASCIGWLVDVLRLSCGDREKRRHEAFSIAFIKTQLECLKDSLPAKLLASAFNDAQRGSARHPKTVDSLLRACNGSTFMLKGGQIKVASVEIRGRHREWTFEGWETYASY
jgi:hypothetical protein